MTPEVARLLLALGRDGKPASDAVAELRLGQAAGSGTGEIAAAMRELSEQLRRTRAQFDVLGWRFAGDRYRCVTCADGVTRAIRYTRDGRRA